MTENSQDIAGSIIKNLADNIARPMPIPHMTINPLDFPSPTEAFTGAIRYLLDLNPRLLRACVIFESDSPLNIDPINNLDNEKSEFMVSFVYRDEEAGGAGDIRFLNFILNVPDDLSTIAGLYEAVQEMQDGIEQALKPAQGGGKMDP